MDSKHSQITRNQKGNQVNIPTVRTKTSGAKIIKSKSVNTWNDLNKLFIKKQLVNQKTNCCKSLVKSYFIKGYRFRFPLFSLLYLYIYIYILRDCMFVVLLV